MHVIIKSTHVPIPTTNYPHLVPLPTLLFPNIYPLVHSLLPAIKLTVSLQFPSQTKKKKSNYSTVTKCLRHRPLPKSRWRTLYSLRRSSLRVPPKLCSSVAQVSNLRTFHAFCFESHSIALVFSYF